MDAFSAISTGAKLASQNLVDNFTEKVNQMGKDLKELYDAAPDLMPSSASGSEDSEKEFQVTEEQIVIDEINQALQYVHQALESVEPNKSPEELSELLIKYDKSTKKVLDQLLFRISKETDDGIRRESILQAKMQIYEDWVQDVIEHSKVSYPEASKASEALSQAHSVLFSKYPGKGGFSTATDAEVSELSDSTHKAMDAASFLEQADLTMSRPSLVTREMTLGSGALKKTPEDLAFYLRVKKFIQTFIPIFNWLPNYQKVNLQPDIIAGLTSGIFVIPQAMAYSLLIGVPPKYGLYSAFIPAILYSFFGGCGQVAYGPVAMLSLLLNTALQDFPDATVADKVALCIYLSFLKGFTQLLMGILKFGFITTFLSQPVLSGFTSAAAIIIIITQLKLIFGVSAASSPYPVVTLYNTLASLGEFRWATFLLSLGSIGFLLIAKHFIVVIPKTKIPFPGAMVIVVFGIVLMVAAPDLQNTIDIVGAIPDGLPPPQFPISMYAYNHTGALVLDFLVMALLSFLEMITVGKLYSSKNGYTVEPNGELVAGGISNIVGSFFSCFPVTGGFGRSPVNANAGAKTQLTGLISSTVVIVVLLWLTTVFSYLPKAVLASIIFVAVLAIIDSDQAKYLWKVNKSEFGLMLITFIITLGIGPQYGIFLSIFLSLLLVLFKSSRPGFAILGRLPGTAVYRSIIDFPEAICVPGIVLFQYHSPIYFMNATYFKRKLIFMESLLTRHTKTEVIIIDAQAITSIDSVGLSMIKEVVETFQKRNVTVCFAAITGRAESALERAGIKGIVGEKNFFPRLHDAIRAAMNNELQPPNVAPMENVEIVELPTLKKKKGSFFGKISKKDGKVVIEEAHDDQEEQAGDGTEEGDEKEDSPNPSNKSSDSSDSSSSSDDKVTPLDL
eukprot:TRINITY_DN5120_c0_g1_i1.p1 TRINITY_DN5120_c0_g1~~TRINITY_DN5120_c0_g1_i1.p1  ORF type:complete len:901 (-),score=194.52 TRINITY_DN5120_c0_g1_i1:38-2740(-)